jgi:hypothetical protein
MDHSFKKMVGLSAISENCVVLSVIPGEQQLLFVLAINSGVFYVIFQRENHLINKRLKKPRR